MSDNAKQWLAVGVVAVGMGLLILALDFDRVSDELSGLWFFVVLGALSLCIFAFYKLFWDR